MQGIEVTAGGIGGRVVDRAARRAAAWRRSERVVRWMLVASSIGLVLLGINP